MIFTDEDLQRLKEHKDSLEPAQSTFYVVKGLELTALLTRLELAEIVILAMQKYFEANPKRRRRRGIEDCETVWKKAAGK